jgi:hypothetical protein
MYENRVKQTNSSSKKVVNSNSFLSDRLYYTGTLSYRVYLYKILKDKRIVVIDEGCGY